MKAIKFDILGKFAHFKNAENNIKIELTYGHIPKTAVLGQLGAVIGLRGLQQERELGYVEYLEEFKDVKISIVPYQARYRKCIDNLNNATGFANKEGSNQVLRRQLLEDVRWTIYVAKDGLKDEHYYKILDMLKQGKTTYPLNLGKTECKARVLCVEEVEINNVKLDEIEKCDSLLLDGDIEIENEVNDDFWFEDDLFVAKYYLPIGYNNILIYNLEKFIYTNSFLSVKSGNFFEDNDKILCFY